MPQSAIESPKIDPTPIFEHFRGSYGTELLTAAVAHFKLFDQLADQSKSFDQLRQDIKLETRPAVVLFTALRAMGLLQTDEQGQLALTALSREHLLSDAYFKVDDYVGLASESPGVLEMVQRLSSNSAAGADEDQGAAFIYRDGMESAMEIEASARQLTLALAGRAKNVAPSLAEVASLDDAEVLLDVGGGTGIYSIACLQRYPQLRAIVFDRPQVLKVAKEFAQEYGVTDRLSLHAGDMFSDPLPKCDVALLSNILHDWDVPQCQELVNRCAESIHPGGRVLIHDVLLNDAHDGPLPIALYSAALFTLTQGRAYSAVEFGQWLRDARLSDIKNSPTLVHCAVIEGKKG
jgi:predicted O-methyltransferase YrrM